jgi:hypothetical protein
MDLEALILVTKIVLVDRNVTIASEITKEFLTRSLRPLT